MKKKKWWKKERGREGEVEVEEGGEAEEEEEEEEEEEDEDEDEGPEQRVQRDGSVEGGLYSSSSLNNNPSSSSLPPSLPPSPRQVAAETYHLDKKRKDGSAYLKLLIARQLGPSYVLLSSVRRLQMRLRVFIRREFLQEEEEEGEGRREGGREKGVKEKVPGIWERLNGKTKKEEEGGKGGKEGAGHFQVHGNRGEGREGGRGGGGVRDVRCGKKGGGKEGGREGGRVRDVRYAMENTGVMHLYPNKGGLAVSLRIRATTLVFVACHLAAHEGRKYERHGQVKEIVKGARSVGPEGGREGGRVDLTEGGGHVFWFGGT